MREALTSSGLDEHRALSCERLVADGRIVVGVHALSLPETKDAREILERHGDALIHPVEPDATEPAGAP